MSGPLIEVELTPNPDALRILTGTMIWTGAPVEAEQGEDCDGLPLAGDLLGIAGLSRVMVGPDFVTIVRASRSVDWGSVKAPAIAVVADYLLSGRPAVTREDVPANGPDGEDDLVVAQIGDVLERLVRPVLARDGGEVVFLGFDHASGILRIRLGGACGGCPSALMTLKRGIEQTVKRYVPEVKEVRTGAVASAAREDPKARFRAWVEARWGG